jgi:hypothetical protein
MEPADTCPVTTGIVAQAVVNENRNLTPEPGITEERA